MKRRLTALIAFLSSVAVVAAPPAHADQVVAATDPAGDVQILSDAGGLSPSQRRSIDLQKLAVITGDDTTRFVIKLKQVLPRASFDQMVFVMIRSRGVTPVQRTDIGLTAQNSTKSLSYAYFMPDATEEDLVSCDPLTARIRKAKRVVFLDVPQTCLPDAPAKIRLTSVTGTFRSDGTGYSRDTMKVPGTVLLK
jgi:hypothetical protein